jgi:hypothetical protein
MKPTISLLMLGLSPAGALFAQAPGVAIEPPKDRDADAVLIQRARDLKDAGRLLLNLDETGQQLRTVSNACLALPSPRKRALKPAEVYQLARQSRLRIGWFYLCKKCDHWHFDGAGGYPITADGVLATCYHVVSVGNNRPNMREGYLVAADSNEKVYPVEKILAKSRTMDAVIVRAAGLSLQPLPLGTNISPGDTVYCYSDPLSLKGVFTEGIVNRFFWESRSRGEKGSLDEIKRLRMNVSCPWAPGSSGSAILDRSGNVVGHVSGWGVLQPEPEPPASSTEESQKPAAKTQSGAAPGFQYYEAIPALGVRSLAQGAGPPASKPKKGKR